jgi:two-component system, chemotaxis family, chemotaxis protein CheY
MKCLIAEDDFAARKLLQIFLTELGECCVASNGQEAVDAFCEAYDTNVPYDLVCMDIMMPEKDGHQALREIRAYEEAHGIQGTKGVKVIMITALRDSRHVLGTFRVGCEAYIVKPVEKSTLFEEMEKLGLTVNQVL